MCSAAFTNYTPHKSPEVSILGLKTHVAHQSDWTGLPTLHLSSFFRSLTFPLSRLLQASNGNDPWSVWNSDPSGGSNNNWASNPEGTQTGSAASQGHPQAYQGPGKNGSSVVAYASY